MSLIDTMKRVVGIGHNSGAVETEEPIVEAAGLTLEEEGFRRLTGDSQRDLTPMSRERMQKVVYYLWQTNVLANRLIELPLA